jgi:glycosyltransferase involved in cell wall biosynthesis
LRTATIVVCVRKRPHGCARAIRSAFAQRGAQVEVEVVAVDADPAGSAAPILKALAAEAPCRFVWTHAPGPGYGRARNVALAEARGDVIAFLDDDQEADRGWLGALVSALRANEADAAFGPIEARLPEGVLAGRRFVARLASRGAAGGPGADGSPLEVGGAAFVRTRTFRTRTPFDEAASPIGGEADALLAAAQTAGATFVWSPDARVRVHLEADRARLGPRSRERHRTAAGGCRLWLRPGSTRARSRACAWELRSILRSRRPVPRSLGR